MLAEPQWLHHLSQLFHQLGSSSALPNHQPHSTAAARDKSAAARKGLQHRGVQPTSTFRGVTVHKRAHGYCAQAWVDGKQVALGRFMVEQQAAAAQDVVLLHTRGLAAKTNFASMTYASLLNSLQQVGLTWQKQADFAGATCASLLNANMQQVDLST